ALLKFFAHAFGNIFEGGVLFDPEAVLHTDEQTSAPLPFAVCGEEAVTVVAGWDRPDAPLLLTVTTPSGATVTSTSPGVELAAGRRRGAHDHQAPGGGRDDPRPSRPATAGDPGRRHIPARQATLDAFEQAAGATVITYADETRALDADAASTGGIFEESAIF